MAQLNKWITKGGTQLFQLLKGRSNAYLVVTPKGNIIVDTGKYSSLKLLEQNLNSLDITSKTISFLILTHTHFDHCQNAQIIKLKYHCPIVAGKQESGYATQGFTPLAKGRFIVNKPIAILGNLIGPPRFGYRPFSIDREVTDEVTFEPDFPIRLISTSGHTVGSLSVIVDQEFALVGDAMFGVIINSISPPFADNWNMLMQSWKKLLETNAKYYFPGHGLVIKKELAQQCFEHYQKKNGNLFQPIKQQKAIHR